MEGKQLGQILDGKAVAQEVRDRLKAKVDEYIGKGFRRPGLAVVLVGDNPASQIYVKNKVQACKKVGIESSLRQFGADVDEQEVYRALAELNAAAEIDGILVQLPLPAHLATERVLDAVAPQKDVDGLHPLNLGLLLAGRPGLRPCTPQGVMTLIEKYEIPIAGKRAVVIGRSNLVGKPVALMLMEKNATVTICHSRTQGLDELVRQADILVVAAGKEELVRGSWIKPGAVVVDVGIHRRPCPAGADEIVGDVHYQEAAAVASYLTPVPGGVGPMTVAMLLANTLSAYERSMSRQGLPEPEVSGQRA